jgi:hypothetical protein
LNIHLLVNSCAESEKTEALLRYISLRLATKHILVFTRFNTDAQKKILGLIKQLDILQGNTANQIRQVPEKIVIIHNLKRGKYYLRELRSYQLQVQKSYEIAPTKDQHYQAGFCSDSNWDVRGNVMTPWGQEHLCFITNQTIQFFLMDEDYDGDEQEDKFNPKVYNDLVIKELGAHLKTAQPQSKCIFKEVQRILESELPPFLAGDREWIPFLNTFQPYPKSAVFPPQDEKEPVYTVKMMPSALAETWMEFRDKTIGENSYNVIYQFIEKDEPDENTQNREYVEYKKLQHQALKIIEERSLYLSNAAKNAIFKFPEVTSHCSGMSIMSYPKISKKVSDSNRIQFSTIILLLFLLIVEY